MVMVMGIVNLIVQNNNLIYLFFLKFFKSFQNFFLVYKMNSNPENTDSTPVENTTPTENIEPKPVENATPTENAPATEGTRILTPEEEKQLMEQIIHYRNVAITFINKNKQELVQIYIQHIKTAPIEDKEGVLGINLGEIEEKHNIDVAFIPVKVLPVELVNKILERQKVNNENIIYFLLITPLEEQILEVDIRSLAS